MYIIGENIHIPIGSTDAAAGLSLNSSLALLLENGVVSGTYLPSEKSAPVVAFSWFPPGKEDYGGWPYPETPQDVASIVTTTSQAAGFPTNTPGFRALPDLVMLCVETYKSVPIEASTEAAYN